MIIIIDAYGGHSNRLFQNLHFEAFCMENGIKYINPSFSSMHKYYVKPCKIYDLPNFLLLKLPLIFRIMKRMKLLTFVSFNDWNTPLPLSYKHNTYISGWCFRVPELTEKHQDYFISKYSLKEKYYKNNKLYLNIKKQKEDGYIIVGIHIRRGDYKLWNGGKYFFTDDVYMKYKMNVEKEIEIKYNRPCKFIFFSEDSLSFIESENIYISKEDWYIDQFLMGKCDFLIGPPSTFTLWASYIGKVKYWHIKSNNELFNLNNFMCCKGY